MTGCVLNKYIKREEKEEWEVGAGAPRVQERVGTGEGYVMGQREGNATRRR